MKRSFKRPLAFVMAAAISASMLPSAFASQKVEKSGTTHELYATDVKVTVDGEVSYKTACLNHPTEEISNADYTDVANVTVSKITVAPTCTETGYYYYAVSIYGDDITETVSNHYTANLTDAEYYATGHKSSGQYVYENNTATCTEGGTATRYTICATCGEKYDEKTVKTEALGHDYELKSSDSLGNLTYVCTRCGDTKTVDYKHTHEQGEWVQTGYKAPTCTADGSITYTAYCSVCGVAVDTKTETVKTPGHQGPVNGYKLISAPTCTTEGSYEELHICDVCGKEYKVTKTIAKAEHTYETKTVSDTATCTNAGILTTQVVCSVCGDVKADSTVESFSKAKGHAIKSTKENVVEATCVKEGSYDLVRTCSRCGLEISRSLVVVPATDKHDVEYKLVWMDSDKTVLGDKDVLTREGTPMFAYAAVCKTCGRVQTVTQWIQSTPIPSKTVEPAYACSTGSKTFTATLTYVDENGKKHEATEEKTFAYYPSGKPADHTYATTTEVTKAATCTEDGVKTTETKCTVCGAVDESKTVTEKIAATGHDYAKEVSTAVTTPATYTAAGVETTTTTETCKNCGDVKTSSVDSEISKLTVDKQKMGYTHNVATRRLQVSFNKFVPEIDGYTVKYQIRYATNSSFTKNVKNKYTVKSSKMLTGLTKGKTYYVKVRTLLCDEDGNVVAKGKYSERTKVLIKK